MILFLLANIQQPQILKKIKKGIDNKMIKVYNYIVTQLHFYTIKDYIMTIAKFVEHYKDESLVSEALPVGTTALRNYIKENKTDLESEKIVKIIKKLNSQKIDILKPDELYEKIIK